MGVKSLGFSRCRPLGGEWVNWAFKDAFLANIVIISSRVNTDSGCARILEEKGHVIFLKPALIEPRGVKNWQPAEAWHTGALGSAGCCKLCQYTLDLGSFHGKRFEDFTNHLESRDHKQRTLEMSDTPPTPNRNMQLSCRLGADDTGDTEPLTMLWWEISSCPVPDSCDAHLVVGRINRALEKSCFSGAPVTITAIGNLNPTLNEAPGVLPALASAGARLEHYPGGLEFIWGDMMRETLTDPPPANIILLISSGFHEHFLRGFWALKKIGYNVKVESGVPLLQCLVKDNQATRGLVLQDTCSENEDV